MGSQAADPHPGHGGSHGTVGMRSSPCSSGELDSPPCSCLTLRWGLLLLSVGLGGLGAEQHCGKPMGHECISIAAIAMHITAGKHLEPI